MPGLPLVQKENFSLEFFDELEKQLLIKKLMKWAKQNVRILILMLYFFKNRKTHLQIWFYTCVSKIWWYDLQFLRIRVWQTKIGNYGSVFALLTPSPRPDKNPKNQNFEKWKNCWSYHSTYLPKTTIIWGMVSEIEWDRQTFFSFWAIFCPFTA